MIGHGDRVADIGCVTGEGVAAMARRRRQSLSIRCRPQRAQHGRGPAPTSRLAVDSSERNCSTGDVDEFIEATTRAMAAAARREVLLA
jgi:hypothetical protein